MGLLETLDGPAQYNATELAEKWGSYGESLSSVYAKAAARYSNESNGSSTNPIYFTYSDFDFSPPQPGFFEPRMLCFFIISNLLVTTAGWVMIKLDRRIKAEKKFDQAETRPPTVILSADLMIIQIFTAFGRLYWCNSPPALWADERLPMRLVCWFDMFSACFVWIYVVFQMVYVPGRNPADRVPWFCRWHVLVGVSFFIGVSLCQALPPQHTHYGHPFPLTDAVMMFTSFADCASIVPQLFLIYSSTCAAGRELQNIIGLLCMGRITRGVFWMWLISVTSMVHTDMVMQIACCAAPDVIHTILMADYVYLWIKRIKEEQFDPMLKGLGMV